MGNTWSNTLQSNLLAEHCSGNIVDSNKQYIDNNYNIDADPTIPDAYLDPTDPIAIQAKASIPQIKDPANAYLREIQRRMAEGK